MDILIPGFKKMLSLLIKHKVNFMLIGGYAVIYHGYERLTTDMDVWLQPENKNRDQLITALKELGIGEDSLKKLSETNFKEISFFHYGERPQDKTDVEMLQKINQFKKKK